MAMGPVQVLVVGFGPDAEFKGEALDQLRLLREQDIVRVIDLLVVHHKEDGTVEKIEIADHAELAELGALAGALIGFGAAGEEGAEAGAEAGAELGDKDELYDDAEVWYIADSIPRGHDRRDRASSSTAGRSRCATPSRSRRRRAGRQVAPPAGPARRRRRDRDGARRLTPKACAFYGVGKNRWPATPSPAIGVSGAEPAPRAARTA